MIGYLQRLVKLLLITSRQHRRRCRRCRTSPRPATVEKAGWTGTSAQSHRPCRRARHRRQSWWALPAARRSGRFGGQLLHGGQPGRGLLVPFGHVDVDQAVLLRAGEKNPPHLQPARFIQLPDPGSKWNSPSMFCRRQPLAT